MKRTVSLQRAMSLAERMQQEQLQQEHMLGNAIANFADL
jgi:hypothetical protein